MNSKDDTRTRICFVTFTYNCAKDLEALLRHVRDIVDEIVVVDGMSTDETREVAESYGARVYLRKPRGYADPDREFALRKCSYDWVLYLDTDERLNSKLKNEFRDIVNELKGEGYVAAAVNSITVIKRKPILRRRIPWQIRIYNKHYVRYKGIVHELPEVAGSLATLDPFEYYIIHLKGDSWLKYWKHGVKYDYLERIEVFRSGGYLERSLVTLRIAPLASPIILIWNLIRVAPYNVPGLYDAMLTGLHRVLVTTLMSLRGKKREKIAKIVQERGLIQLLKLDRDP